MGKFLDTTGVHAAPQCLFISTDGTKLYIGGSSLIARYTMSTAWDVSTATVDSGNTLTLTSNTSSKGMWFKPDGTKLYVTENASDDVQQYTLTTAWDLSGTVTYNGLYTSTEQQNLYGVSFKESDGSKMYVTGTFPDDVYEYDLTTAWDITGTVTYNSKSVSANHADPHAVFIDNGGDDYMFTANTTDIRRYSLSTAYDVSSATYDTGQTYAPSEDTGSMDSVYIRPNGTELYVANNVTNTINQYTFGTAWDVTTLAFEPPNDAAVTLAQTISATGSIDLHADGSVTRDITIAATGRSTIHANGDVALTPTIAVTGRITLRADGDVALTPTIAVTATNRTTHADGDISLSQTISATGRGTIHVDGDIALSQIISATGRTSIRADGDIALSQTISATGRTSIHADGDVTLVPTISATGNADISADGAVAITPEMTAIADVTAYMRGDMAMGAMTMDGYIEYHIMTLPLLVVDAVMEQTLPSSMTMAPLTITGEIVPGAYAEGLMTLPLLEAAAYGDNAADVTLPSLVADGAMITSSVSVGQMRIPSLILTSGVGDDRFLDDNGYLSLPSLTMVGNSVNSPIVDGNMTIPLLSAFGVNAAGTVLTGVASLPIFTMDSLVSAMVSAGLLTANLTLPAIEAQGYMQITATLTHSGWAFNTESMRTSEYDNYNYLLVANVFGKNIGVSNDGVYELTGDTDSTVDIDADVLFGFDSFRTEDLKRVKTVHIGYRADNAGALNVQIVVDGEDKIREYSVKHISSTSGIKRGRATVAKGLKSRYWGYGVKNVAGADFLVDDLSVFVQQHNRKT